MTNKMTNPNVK